VVKVLFRLWCRPGAIKGNSKSKRSPDSIPPLPSCLSHFLQQLANSGSIGRITAVMCKVEPSFAIDQEIPAGLKVIIPTVALDFPAVPVQMSVHLYCCPRKDTIPSKELEAEVRVGLTLRIREKSKWPGVNALVVAEPLRLREGDDDNAHPLLFKLL